MPKTHLVPETRGVGACHLRRDDRASCHLDAGEQLAAAALVVINLDTIAAHRIDRSDPSLLIESARNGTIRQVERRAELGTMLVFDIGERLV